MEAIGVKCPVCRAGRGRPCRDHSTRNLVMNDFHPARESLADGKEYARDNSDSFGKWIVRGIAIGIGLLVVEVPLVLIAALLIND